MSEDLEPPDNVVHVRFKRSKEDLPTPPIRQATPATRRPFCEIHFFEYDLDERVVTCTRCGRHFDAFEAFDSLAKRWKSYDYTHRHVRGEIAELQKERDRLAKQVVNLKARRRRLVPNIRQDVERVRSELWRHGMEKNPTIAAARMQTIRTRLEKILQTIEAFGDAAEEEG